MYIIMNNEFSKKCFNLSFWFAQIQKVCFILRFLKKPLYNVFNNSRFPAFHYINFNLKLTRSTHQVTSQSHENKERSKIKILVAFLLVLFVFCFVLLFFFDDRKICSYYLSLKLSSKHVLPLLLVSPPLYEMSLFLSGYDEEYKCNEVRNKFFCLKPYSFLWFSFILF